MELLHLHNIKFDSTVIRESFNRYKWNKRINSYNRTEMKRCVLFAAWLLLWPIALLYVMSKHRDDILQDMLADMKYRKANFTGINAVLYVFLLDKYYRTLFYHRIGSISYIVRWIWPGYNTFHPLCNNIGGGVFCIHPFPPF